MVILVGILCKVNPVVLQVMGILQTIGMIIGVDRETLAPISIATTEEVLAITNRDGLTRIMWLEVVAFNRDTVVLVRVWGLEGRSMLTS
jgi:hypothetical protein